MIKTKEMLKNEIIAEMIIRRNRNDNKQVITKLVYYIVLFIVIGLFLVVLDSNNTAINNIINK